jgi:phage terminase small subunit
MSLNSRQETFCQLKSTGAITDTEAYRQAGYTSKRPDINVAQLIRNSKVIARIAELRQEIAEKLNMTRETVATMALEHRRLALAKDDLNAANGSLVIAAKAFGLQTDKLMTEQSQEQKELTEMQKAEAQRLSGVMLRLRRSGVDGQEGA